MNSSKNINIFILICLGLFFFDLGNLDALRQGTEGFYLLITREMFEAKSFLTPLIYGAPHWSKPPFVFWLPQPLYWLSGGQNYLEMGRLSILLFSLLSTFLVSQWYEKELKRNWYECFSILLLPLYFIKYSRIFMMEMPLAYLSTLGSLYFYSYLKRQNTKNLIMASFFTGLSVLVKGPVSLAMIFPSAFVYGLYRKKGFTPFIKFVLASTFIGSLWFIASYQKYGSEFFEYFFIRENLGKFTSRRYPLSSVIQGLIIFTIPANFLLIPIFKYCKTIDFKKDHLYFFFINFFFFYFLWFLPKQRSHHYAVPAIPFFLLSISYLYFNLNSKAKALGLNILKITNNFLIFFSAILLGILFYFKNSLPLSQNNHYLLGALCIIPLYFYLSHLKDLRIKYLRFTLPFILFWQFVLPMGVLPLLPKEVHKISQEHSKNKLFSSYRKPFFIKEGLHREIQFIPNRDFSNYPISKNDLILTELQTLKKTGIEHNYKILHQWKLWRRGRNFKEIREAFFKQDLSPLQEYYIIAQKI